MKKLSFSDKVLLVGVISLVLYFGLMPLFNEAFPNWDVFELQVWFLVVGIILIVIGVLVKFTRKA